MLVGVSVAAGAAGDDTGQVTENLRGVDNVKSAVSNVNFDKTGEKAVAGAIAGGLGGTAGAVVGKGLQAAVNSTKAIQSSM